MRLGFHQELVIGVTLLLIKLPVYLKVRLHKLTFSTTSFTFCLSHIALNQGAQGRVKTGTHCSVACLSSSLHKTWLNVSARCEGSSDRQWRRPEFKMSLLKRSQLISEILRHLMSCFVAFGRLKFSDIRTALWSEGSPDFRSTHDTRLFAF